MKLISGHASYAQALMAVALLAQASCSSSDSKAADPAVATFWQDVAPIYNDRCVRCHQEGGIGPFRLDDYASAKLHAADELVQVNSGAMPPYSMVHDGSCESFHDETTLTAADKSTIAGWVTGGALEGSPVTLTRPMVPTLADAVEIKTPSFSPVAVGDALAANDEYRCFELDMPTASDAFITGYQVIPGDASIVHHALGFLVDPARVAAGGHTNAELMKALDDASPDRLGWPCFGAAGEGIDVSGVPVAWAPGQGVLNYPAGMGLPVHATDKLVVQVHYNLADPASAGKTDSTTIQLRFANSVERELSFFLPDPLLGSLKNVDAQGNPAPDLLPPGQADAKYTWTRTGQQVGINGVPSVDLVAVAPHMHGRGLRQQLKIGSPDALACAAHLENWNFHWQQFYFYKSPPKITPTTQLEVTCEYNTQDDTQPVMPGWGTRNEMCLAMLMVALPAH